MSRQPPPIYGMFGRNGWFYLTNVRKWIFSHSQIIKITCIWWVCQGYIQALQDHMHHMRPHREVLFVCLFICWQVCFSFIHNHSSIPENITTKSLHLPGIHKYNQWYYHYKNRTIWNSVKCITMEKVSKNLPDAKL